MIADEIFHADGDGDLEDGEAVDEPLHHGDEEEDLEDEESGRPGLRDCQICLGISKKQRYNRGMSTL